MAIRYLHPSRRGKNYLRHTYEYLSLPKNLNAPNYYPLQPAFIGSRSYCIYLFQKGMEEGMAPHARNNVG